MTDNSNFFSQPQMDNQQPQAPQEPQTVSLGEKEYSQEELTRLVGLGERAVELESKWNTPIDSLMPEYTKATQERAELNKRNAELESQIQAAVQEKVQTGAQLTPEEEARMVREQAKKYGLADEDRARQIVHEELEVQRNEQLANQLINETESYLQTQASEGKPKTNVKDMITFMNDNGINSYENAYKIKYEKELDDWKMQKLTANRPSGLYTQSQSTAGAKQPEEKRLNSTNLASAIEEVLSR